MFILTLFSHSFSHKLKSDTRGLLIDFSFSILILMLILMGYAHGSLVSKQII